MKYLLGISVLVLLTLGGCTKETQTSEGNPIPIIFLVKAEPNSIQQFKDSFTITLGYEDGDGDIGYENADINTLEIKDTRLTKPDYFYVPPQAPTGSKIHIKGQLVVKLRNLFLLGSGAAETTTLEIRLQDRAGNWSNKITTAQLTINK
ncbi:MAG: hypothetical protein IT244_09005 [Bacteroidia bacterium]|nr:hypothetical protein [Bacteroidia bacterium]